MEVGSTSPGPGRWKGHSEPGLRSPAASGGGEGAHGDGAGAEVELAGPGKSTEQVAHVPA